MRMDASALLLLSAGLVLSAAAGKEQKPKKKKDVRDFNDSDLERFALLKLVFVMFQRIFLIEDSTSSGRRTRSRWRRLNCRPTFASSPTLISPRLGSLF